MIQNHFSSHITNISKRYAWFLAFLVYVLSFLPMCAQSQTPGEKSSLDVSGEVKNSLVLTLSALDTMKRVSVSVKDHAEKEHTYTGVELFAILKKAGVTLGEELRGKNLTKYILMEAGDGYQVVFSLAEADPTFSQKKFILATRKDNALLPANEGPFRIIIDGEPRQSRSIRQVTHIKIKYAG